MRNQIQIKCGKFHLMKYGDTSYMKQITLNMHMTIYA